ncbi:MAG: hypothetical protein KTR31_09835 [Myxococcales bacterium]|nr:hypothetical protein [Myxococcales bacterium]
MIHRYDMNTLRRWNRGEFKVQIQVPGRDRPIAYCDGTEEDLQELRATAEEEGTTLPDIHRRILKTGREIWTMGVAPPPQVEDDD